MHHDLKLTCLALCAVSVVAQTVQDPINNFCRRFGHQTTLIDNRLFVDGGYVDYGGSIDGSTQNYTNTFLLYADVSSDSSDQFPIMYNNLSKPAYVPSVIGGALWPDTVNKLFYLYGGEYNWTTSPPTTPALWFFDALYNTWNKTANGISGVQAASFGASAVDPVKAVGYYYGGWTSNATTLGWNGNPVAQQGLVTYDMAKNGFRNQSFIDNTPRAEGLMFWIPISDAGMLVYFGGIQQMANGSYTGAPMDQIHLFDIASQNFYTQFTSGPTPPKRRRFCGGVSWPDDRSSFNIYFYGGNVPPDEQGYGWGDVWILSIPSFTWVPYWNGTGSDHHSTTCNVINEGQMIVMGGTFPNSSNTNCDSSVIWGMHNLNLGSDNPDKAQWYHFLPNLTSYQVPPNLTAVIGGSSSGGASVVTPQAGYGHPDLAVYLTRTTVAALSGRTATRDVSTATASTKPSSKASSTNIGAIVGGVVGGVCALLLILGIVVCCLWRRRRSRMSNPGSKAPSGRRQSNRDAPYMSEMSGDGQVVEAPTGLHSPGSSYASPHKQGYGSSMATPSTAGLDPNTAHGSPEHDGTHWQPLPTRQPQHRFHEDLPKQYYPPPPQAQQYYPRPPTPQTQDAAPPAFEMPSVRSPIEAQYRPPRQSPQITRTIAEE